MLVVFNNLLGVGVREGLSIVVVVAKQFRS